MKSPLRHTGTFQDEAETRRSGFNTLFIGIVNDSRAQRPTMARGPFISLHSADPTYLAECIVDHGYAIGRSQLATPISIEPPNIDSEFCVSQSWRVCKSGKVDRYPCHTV